MSVRVIKGSEAEGDVREREKWKGEERNNQRQAWSPVSQALQRSHYLPGSQQHVVYITYWFLQKVNLTSL